MSGQTVVDIHDHTESLIAQIAKMPPKKKTTRMALAIEVSLHYMTATSNVLITMYHQLIHPTGRTTAGG